MRHTKPQLNLVNKVSLDMVLKAEIYVNEADDQLHATHLILGYTPLLFAFQAPKCMIRARDPRLHRISVAYQGFVVPEGITLPRDASSTQPLVVATPSVGASTSQPVLEEAEEQEEGEKEEEERGSEEVVDVSDSSDEFEVFDRTQSVKDCSEEMGVQRKPKRTLQELIENQPGKSAPVKSTQSQIPPPPTKSPSSASHQPTP